MSVTNLGDLSQSFSMRQRNTSLRADISRLTDELASGQVSDVRNVLSGNYSFLTDIERQSSILDAYQVSTSEAGLFAEATQKALANFESFGSDLSGSLITAGTSAIGVTGSDTSAEARNTLAGMVGSLNSNVAGRFLFSGSASDQVPLPDADTLLNALRNEFSGASTPDDILLAADTWFNDPAGFEATIYQGGSNAISPFNLSEADSVSMDVRAMDTRILEVIKLTAVAALADDSALAFDVSTQSELFGKAGQALLNAQDEVISLRSEVGSVEARIEGIATRNAAEQTSMQFAKAEMLEVDPYEAATQLEEAQFQLESLYSVTVRMSRLSLSNFL